jgi:hypothetical protein
MCLDEGTWSTPLELAHCVKPDLRVLFKMFGLAAVRHEQIGDAKLGKFDSQSVPMIAVGRCTNSYGLLFYNPANSTFVSSVDYKFQLNTTSGAHFGYKYQSGTFFYRLDETNSIFSPKFAIDSMVYVHTHLPPPKAKIIGLPTYDSPNVYTVAFKDGSLSEYSEDMLSIASLCPQPLSSSLLPKWIQGGANATLFLHHMSKPRHGTLGLSDHNWYFYPGKSKEGILLSDLSANCQQLMDTAQLFRGHTKFKHVYDARAQLRLKDCVL